MGSVFNDHDKKAVDIAKALAADSVEKVGNGHPGTAISLAPLAYLLYQKVMAVDPTDPAWLGRDRFILSVGHSSLTQYVQLFLGGLGVGKIEDLKALRTWGLTYSGPSRIWPYRPRRNYDRSSRPGHCRCNRVRVCPAFRAWSF